MVLATLVKAVGSALLALGIVVLVVAIVVFVLTADVARDCVRQGGDACEGEGFSEVFEASIYLAVAGALLVPVGAAVTVIGSGMQRAQEQRAGSVQPADVTGPREDG